MQLLFEILNFTKIYLFQLLDIISNLLNRLGIPMLFTYILAILIFYLTVKFLSKFLKYVIIIFLVYYLLVRYGVLSV